MNHFSLFQTATCLLSALLSAADRAVVVVAVKSSSSRSGDSFRVFFFSAPLREPTRTKEHTKLLVFYSSLSSLMSARLTHRANRTERNELQQQQQLLSRYSVPIFNGVSALLPFTSRLFRTNTPPRRFFFLRFKFPTHETGLTKNREPFSLLSSSNSSRFRTRKGHRMCRFSTATGAGGKEQKK